MDHPRIIQGGMGVAVSGWALARAVSQTGQLGVVSGTAIAHILARKLQLGDADGHLRRALAQFPIPGISQRILSGYFVPGGKAPGAAFKAVPMPSATPSTAFNELTIAAAFVEVFLAKEGHPGKIGINLLEKIQFNTQHTLYGAMLAGVDYVIMGAGIPRTIPGTLDDFASGRPSELKIDLVAPANTAPYAQHFDPASLFGSTAPQLKRPLFLAIVSSATLAITLAKKSTGRVDGFIVELDSAGGHNAPPRGLLQLTPEGEPIYGLRDNPDFEKIRAIGLPFWLAGAFGAPGRCADAVQQGAVGIQVGTAFAFCRESGIDDNYKNQVLELSRAGRARVFTDPLASPTGFPFKVLQLDNTLSAEAEYASRPRICDMGYLRHAYQQASGGIGYRCPSEPVEDYLRKGGAEADTVGRKCLCNGLMSASGLGQIRPDGTFEPPILTAGNEVARIAQFLPPGATSYSAADVVAALLA